MGRKIISLFSGAGGLDLGFEAAGFDIGSCLEMDRDCLSTLEPKNEAWGVIPDDIHNVSSEEILNKSGLAVGDADVLVGGPPCQPFSKSAYWATGDSKRMSDFRAGTLEQFLRVLRDTLPRAFLLENVEGLSYQGKSEGIDYLRRSIDLINNECGTSYYIPGAEGLCRLNAADYGVPQVRKRVFIIGSRDGQSLRYPAQTHCSPDQSQLLGLEPYRTAWDALSDLDVDDDDPELQPRGKWADLLPSIPEGQNYLWHTDRGGGLPLFGWRRRFWSFLLKLSKDLPSWTIQAHPGPATGPFHWDNRRLSREELCRLQTFPDWYEVKGSLAQVQKQVGNAVPVALAEILARSIRRQFFGDKVNVSSGLVPEKSLAVPPESRVLEVPEKYRELIGDYEAHPGTGLGFRAANGYRPQ